MIWWVVAIWAGCLLAEALDGFTASRRIVRELRCQWVWVRGFRDDCHKRPRS